MRSDGPEVTFRAVTAEHQSLLRAWLSSPHAREWWGDPEEELALIYDDKGEHEPFLACVDGRPVAYVQAWWPSKHPELGWQQELSLTTRGIDITIGHPDDLGRGLGSLIVKRFAARLFAEGATRLVIDPDSRNQRAIAAYTKAGFSPYGVAEGQGGRDILMHMWPEELAHEVQGRDSRG